MSSKKVPIVAIVGRANVGKSSLFNAILHRREAIVANEPGTTRDSLTAKASYAEQDFWLVDLIVDSFILFICLKSGFQERDLFFRTSFLAGAFLHFMA